MQTTRGNLPTALRAPIAPIAGPGLSQANVKIDAPPALREETVRRVAAHGARIVARGARGRRMEGPPRRQKRIPQARRRRPNCLPCVWNFFRRPGGR
jgi:hypothetical protein